MPTPCLLETGLRFGNVRLRHDVVTANAPTSEQRHRRADAYSPVVHELVPVRHDGRREREAPIRGRQRDVRQVLGLRDAPLRLLCGQRFIELAHTGARLGVVSDCRTIESLIANTIAVSAVLSFEAAVVPGVFAASNDRTA